MEATIMILEKINAQHIQVSLAKFAKKKLRIQRAKESKIRKKLINNRKTSQGVSAK